MRCGAILRLFSSVLLLGIAGPAARSGDGPDRCKLLARALDVVGHGQHRLDLARENDGVPPCQRPDVEGCSYVVEVRQELAAASRGDLSDAVGAAFLVGECDVDMAFASKHGLSAYRDHKAIERDVIDGVVRAAMPHMR